MRAEDRLMVRRGRRNNRRERGHAQAESATPWGFWGGSVSQDGRRMKGSAARKARVRGGDVVLQLEIKFVNQLVGGLSAEIGPHFVDHEVDGRGGVRAELLDGGFDALPGFFKFHSWSSRDLGILANPTP